MREAGIMLIVKDGLILSISRRTNSAKFGLPGGKCEINESPQQAAIRETLEETSIKVNYCSFIYKRVELADGPTGEDFYSYCYYANQWEGEPKSSEEGIVKWLSLKEITSSEHGAFPDYNFSTIESFKKMYPNIYLKE